MPRRIGQTRRGFLPLPGVCTGLVILGDNAWASVFKDQTESLSIMEFRRGKRSPADDAKGAPRTREESKAPISWELNFRWVSPHKIRA
jgi:hypothetical protein